MSSVSLVAASCCAVQIGYLETQNQPNSLGAVLGMIDALKSASNKQGFIGQSLIGTGAPIAGSACKLQLKYIAPDCDASTNVDSLCDDETETTDSPFKTTEFVFVKATDNRGKKFKWTLDQFRCACEGTDQTILAVTDSSIKRILIDEEKALLASVTACLGKYCDGDESLVTPKTANIFDITGVHAQAAGWDVVNSQMAAMGFTGKPIIIGGDSIRKYMYMTKYAGLGANSLGATGNITESSPFEFYYSSEFDKIVSPLAPTPGNYAIVLAPGTTQHIEFLQNNKPGQSLNMPHATYQTISKVIGDRSYDFDYGMVYDVSCRSWKQVINRMAGSWCMPADDYCPDVVGNGRFLIKLGCGEPGCDTSCIPAE